MKVNFSALKDISVGALKIAGWGGLFSLFSGACGLVTAPFGLIGAVGELALVGAGIMLFYPPIKRNFDRVILGAKQFKNDWNASKTSKVSVKEHEKQKTSQYTVSPKADEALKEFFQKQTKEDTKKEKSKPSYAVMDKDVNISVNALRKNRER